MARIVDVAARVLDETGTATTMTLQKLAYYAQAEHLVRTGRPLFPEDFRAWRGGPVAPELFALHAGKFLIRPGELDGARAEGALSTAEEALIAEVCAAFGTYSGAELSERTHSEAPWKDARGDLPPSEPSTTVITKDAIHAYYSEHPVLGSRKH